ncbi:MAG: HEAT repeat domain-containing protein [Chloroflexi bacterium]|nr:HEAT repeat domain-containing protein [Chloroflexota bacterium]
MMTPQQALAALDYTDINIKIAAVEALAHYKYAYAVPQLKALLDSPTVDLRLIVVVVRALSTIGSKEAMDILKTYLFAGTTALSPHTHDQTTYERTSRTDIIHEAVKKAFKQMDTPETRAALAEWDRIMRG